jgi:hypothetical protein
MWPFSWLFGRWIALRKVRLPTHWRYLAGEGLAKSESRMVTRDVCLLPQVTPGQLQYCTDELFFHEAMAPAVLERWSLRQSRAWRSVGWAVKCSRS